MSNGKLVVASLSSLFILVNSGHLFSQDLQYPGITCPSAEYLFQDLIDYRGGIGNYDDQDQAFVVCPIFNDNVTSQYGTIDDLQVRGYDGCNDNSLACSFECTWYVSTNSGVQVFSETANNGAYTNMGFFYLNYDDDPDDYYDYYHYYYVECQIPFRDSSMSKLLRYTAFDN